MCIRDSIYTGQITNWSQVGGNDSEIIAYQRNRDSGSQTLFDLFFPLGDQLIDPPEELIVDSMIGLLEAVADYDNSENALGYTVYYYLTNMETDKLSRSKLLAVDGVEATNETIASGEYPYVNDFYVVIPADLPDDDPVSYTHLDVYKRQALNRETALDAWLILFMAVGFLLMSIIDPYPAIAFEGYRAVVEYMVWFFLIIRLVENDQDMKVLYITVLLLTAFLAFHGIYQYVIGVEIPSSWVSQTEMGVRTRVFSLCGSPNILGSLMVMTAPLWAALIYFCRSTKAKLLALFMTVCCCLTLLFTFSRGAWIRCV